MIVGLRARGDRAYVMAVPHNVRGRAARPATAWQLAPRQEGRTGPLLAAGACVRAVALRDALPGPHGGGVFRRARKAYRCTAAADTPPETLVWLLGLRWPVEQALTEATDARGLDHDAVRGWRGWHHHTTMTRLAHGCLVRLRRRLGGEMPALTVPQVRHLLRVTLPAQRRNAAAARAHRLRRLRRLPLHDTSRTTPRCTTSGSVGILVAILPSDVSIHRCLCRRGNPRRGNGDIRANRPTRSLTRRSDEGDLYYEPDLPGAADYHLSRHKSGTTHWRSRKFKNTVAVSMKIPVEEIIIEQVLATGIEMSTIPNTSKPYEANIADGVFTVDMRNLQSGHPNLFVWLVSPSHIQQLFDQHKDSPTLGAHQFYVYTGVEPWLVLSVVVIAPDPS